VGSIAKIRGIQELCHAMGQVKTGARLNLVGEFSDPSDEQAVRAMVAWKRINNFGLLDREGIKSVYETSIAGLVTLHPISNYLVSLPVKMFEYMSAGIPVIASDFPLWRKIILESNCGLLVNPFDVKAIARAIDFLVENPLLAKQMGDNGRKTVEHSFNWESEEIKLISIYNS